MSDEGRSWSAFYTQSAIDFILEEATSKRVAQRLFKYRELLEAFPDLGQNYDPDYEAAKPPFPCRFVPVPDTPFTLYYLKDEGAHAVVIFCVEHQRQDPNQRFSLINWMDL